MGLAEELAEGMRKHTPGCRTCLWLKEQPSDVRELFDKWLSSGASRSGLLKICSAHGLDVCRSAFNDHFRAGHVVN